MVIFFIFYFLIISVYDHVIAEELSSKNVSCEYVDYSLFRDRATATMYEDVRGHGNLTNKDCNPQYIWSVIRHGVRNHHKDAITRMRNLLADLREEIVRFNNEGRGKLCENDISEISSWVFDELMPYEVGYLTESGSRQQYLNGKRMRDHFPSLLNRTYDEDRYYFGYSQYQRSIKSMRKYAEGIFEYDNDFKSYYIGQRDYIAEYDCHLTNGYSMIDDYELNPESVIFSESSKIFETIAESISTRTGMSTSLYSKTIILTLYEACIFESSRDERISPWCRVFELNDLEMLERREEHFYYTMAGYGSNYSDRFGCKEFKSLISSLDDAVENRSGYAMKALFSHDCILQEIFARMGCFRDSVRTSSDYAHYNVSKIWNMSQQTPFAANLLAVLYKCDLSDDFELQFFLNEKPIGCCMTDSKEACSYSEFRNYHIDFVTNCKENYCKDDDYDASIFPINISASTKVFSNMYILLIGIVNLVSNFA